MDVMKRFACVALAIATALAVGIAAQHDGGQHAGPVSDEGLGRAHMDTSCSPAVAADFDRALVLLHNFWYARALERFNQVAAKDPACAMAYWGAAMTYNHPFWDPPSATDEAAAWALVQKGIAAQEASRREKQYLAAIAALFDGAGASSKQVRDRQYRDAMAAAYAEFPDDETRLFYGLSILGAVQEGAGGFEPQAHAAALFEEVHRHQPDHPGVLHYLIHAYDDPVHAAQGLEAARAYAKAAAAVPHALHMPSHIFTRLGLWQESIDSNFVSAASAKKNDAPGNELHAKDYLIYAYLQGAQDREAKKALEAPPLGRPDDPQYMNWLYAMGTSPARYAVERHQWNEAAGLVVPSNTFPGGRWAWTEANLHFARALGLARTGKTEAARMEALKLASLRDTLTQIGDKYWADQVEIQRESAEAWITLAEGKSEQALGQMRSAADHEDKTDKHNVTPGVILPAREMLGDMLLELKQSTEALVAFESTLRTAPNRFNSLSGAARAAKLSGDNQKAKTYYAKLLSMCEHADGDRPELQEARTLLAER